MNGLLLHSFDLQSVKLLVKNLRPREGQLIKYPTIDTFVLLFRLWIHEYFTPKCWEPT